MKIIIDLHTLLNEEELQKIIKCYQNFKSRHQNLHKQECKRIFAKKYLVKILKDLVICEPIKTICTQFEVVLNIDVFDDMNNSIKCYITQLLKNKGANFVEIHYGSLIKKVQTTFIDIVVTDSMDAIITLKPEISIITKNPNIKDAGIITYTDMNMLVTALSKLHQDIIGKQKTKETFKGKPSLDKPWLKYYPKAGKTAVFEKKSIYDLLLEKNTGRKKFIALNYFGIKISYDELIHRVEKTASAYQKLGVKRGDIVTACVVNTPEVVYTLYALNKLGAVLNVVDPRTTSEGMKRYLNEVKSKFVIILAPFYHLMNEAIELQNKENQYVSKMILISPTDSIPSVLAGLDKIKNNRDSKQKNPKIKYNADRDVTWKEFIQLGSGVKTEKVEFEENTPAILVHTGGTTGTPKGVVITNEAMNSMVTQHSIADLGFEPKQVYLNILVPFVAYGLVMATHLPLCLSMEVVLIPSFDPNNFADLFIKYRPENLLGIPSYFAALKNSENKDKLDFSNLNFAAVGGDSISIEQLKELNDFMQERGFKHRLHTGYGMTEACSGTCCTRDRCYVEGSVGIPLPRTIVSIFEPGTHNELSYNEQGEICISGETLFKEYYNNKTETKNILQLHEDGKYWIHTGDIGKINEDGVVFVDGRMKRMIISSGHKVFPSEVEKIINQHSAVKECVVIGVPHPQHVHVPIVLIILKNEYENQEETVKKDLIELCKCNLPEHKIPFDFIFRKDDFPLTNIGKVDCIKLEDEYKDQLSFQEESFSHMILKSSLSL